MALNKTFTCNTIVDESGNAIECQYQGYHVRTGTWNTVRTSEFNQYSCNLGDGDWLTQTGEVFAGDVVILAFWVSTDATRAGIKDRLCFIAVTLNNDSTYVNDIKIRPKTLPQCGFTFTNNNPTINHAFGINPAVNDNFTYSYGGLTHYHKRTYSGELIFDSIGNLTLTYDWDEGASWETADTHTYGSIGDYTVSQSVINSYNLTKICTQPIRIRYNKPIPGLNFVFTNPIHTTEDVAVNANVQDVDSRITNIKHKLIVRDRNNNDLLQDILVNENLTLDYSYNRTIAILQKHYFTQAIYWNDGFDNKLINYNKQLTITNWCPEVSVLKIDSNNLDKIFTQTSTDLDGSIVGWNWKIYFIPPFGDGSYVEVYNLNAANGNNWEVGFTVQGSYKVQIEVTDDYGCKVTDFTIFDISETSECDFTKMSDVKFIFPKQLGNH